MNPINMGAGANDSALQNDRPLFEKIGYDFFVYTLMCKQRFSRRQRLGCPIQALFTLDCYPAVCPLPASLSRACLLPSHMGNWYHIPDITKQHIFVQNTTHRQNTVAERFRVATRTVRHVNENVRNYGSVSRKPLRMGRPRELSWDDVTVSQSSSPWFFCQLTTP